MERPASPLDARVPAPDSRDEARRAAAHRVGLGALDVDAALVEIELLHVQLVDRVFQRSQVDAWPERRYRADITRAECQPVAGEERLDECGIGDWGWNRGWGRWRRSRGDRGRSRIEACRQLASRGNGTSRVRG